MSDDRRQADDELDALAVDWDEARADEEVAARALERDDGNSEGPWRAALRRFTNNRIAVFGCAVLIFMIVMSIIGPWMGPDDAMTKTFRPEAPSSEHWFGTTRQGQDMWTVAWLGGRVSLSVGIAVALVIFFVGTTYGAISGYVGGTIDNLMMRLLDSLYGLPYVPIAAIVVLFFREMTPDVNDAVVVIVALSVTAWFTAARLMRAQILVAREEPYVESAQSVGARGGRVIRKHLLPNTLGVLVVAAFLEIPGAILGEATLSFLGLGIPPGEPSWGSLAHFGYQSFLTYPHMVIVPGVLIATTVLATTAMADGVRDGLDPRSDTRLAGKKTS